MIGFYDYTVILTYMSLLFSVFGMTQAIEGRFRTAICCLALSGLCDMFDGRVARTKKARTDEEKMFGIQIDSLCDMVCFGIYPIMIVYLLGARGTMARMAMGFYALCSIIRLAYFNVLESSRQQEEGGVNKYYHGLPITSIAIILPLVFLLSFVFPERIMVMLLTATLFIVGILFVMDIHVVKPNNAQCIMMIVVVGLAVGVIFFFSRYHILHFPHSEKPFISELIDCSSQK